MSPVRRKVYMAESKKEAQGAARRSAANMTDAELQKTITSIQQDLDNFLDRTLNKTKLLAYKAEVRGRKKVDSAPTSINVDKPVVELSAHTGIPDDMTPSQRQHMYRLILGAEHTWGQVPWAISSQYWDFTTGKSFDALDKLTKREASQVIDHFVQEKPRYVPRHQLPTDPRATVTMTKVEKARFDALTKAKKDALAAAMLREKEPTHAHQKELEHASTHWRTLQDKEIGIWKQKRIKESALQGNSMNVPVISTAELVASTPAKQITKKAVSEKVALKAGATIDVETATPTRRRKTSTTTKEKDMGKAKNATVRMTTKAGQ